MFVQFSVHKIRESSHIHRTTGASERKDRQPNTKDIEYNNAHRQKDSAKTWGFPEAGSYINIVSSSAQG